MESRVIVCPERDASKTIVPPGQISAIAWRKEPTPLSFVFITVMLFEQESALDELTPREVPNSDRKTRRVMKERFISCFLF
jgi:hypothetical protein